MTSSDAETDFKPSIIIIIIIDVSKNGDFIRDPNPLQNYFKNNRTLLT